MDGGTLAQVASLYLILPTLAAVYGITLFLYYRQTIAKSSSKKDRLPTAERLLLALLLICYFVAYFYLTLSYRSPTKKPRIELSLFWSYHDAFSFSCGGKK